MMMSLPCLRGSCPNFLRIIYHSLSASQAPKRGACPTEKPMPATALVFMFDCYWPAFTCRGTDLLSVRYTISGSCWSFADAVRSGLHTILRLHGLHPFHPLIPHFSLHSSRFNWLYCNHVLLVLHYARYFHAIRLKENGNLRKLASHIDEQLAEITKDDMVSYAVYYGEFQYQAAMLST